MTKLETV